MTLKSGRVRSALRKKGFAEPSSHHRMLVLVVDGGETRISTKMSHGGSEDIGPAIMSQMAKQCHLSNEQFRQLVACPLSADGYVALLRGGGTL